MLVLPIQGNGQSNITLCKSPSIRPTVANRSSFKLFDFAVNPVLSISFDGKTVIRNGKEYLGMEKFRLSFTVSRIHFDFQNLYNGDKLLGDSTNRFLNENWNDIFKEIKANIFDAFSLIAENVIRNVFNKVPYQDLFIE